MIKKIKNKIIEIWFEMADLGWTLAGTGLVLITLSGETLKWGIWMSSTALGLHVLVILTRKDEEGE